MEGIRMLISEAEIAARVEALAAEIAQRRPGDFVIVGLLKGAAMFVADLVRALYRVGAHSEVEFMRLSSYGFAKAVVRCTFWATSRRTLPGGGCCSSMTSSTPA